MEHIDQRVILTFRVADDHIIVSEEDHVGDLTLRGEGFTGTGRTKDQTVGVLQPFPVYHDQIVGQGVEAAVQCFLTGLEQLLCREGHKNSG